MIGWRKCETPLPLVGLCMVFALVDFNDSLRGNGWGRGGGECRNNVRSWIAYNIAHTKPGNYSKPMSRCFDK